MQSAPSRAFSSRYPQLILLTALLFLFFNIIGRVVLDQVAPLSPATEPPPAPIESSNDAYIEKQQEALRHNPNNTYAYAQLGLALLEKVRINYDPALYTQAENAFNETLKRDPDHLDALMGMGILALARHEFTVALEWADQAWAINPYGADILGIMVDAQVELGRYEEALESADKMIKLRPGIPSYTRLSYLRELHGDIPGAIEMMEKAADVGLPGTEAMLWSQVQLGHLYFNSGDLAQAEATYEKALFFRPDYIHAQAAQARLQAARGEYEEAIAAYHPIVERLPLPEFVIALGELYEVTERPKQAQQQYELVRIMQQLNASEGMNVDLELAFFEANHGNNPTEALAKMRTTYQSRPSIYAADALAWALYHNGEVASAQQYSQEALRLGTQDAMLYYHAGKIALALEDEEGAQANFQLALDINPYFSIRDALDIERLTR